MLRSEEYVMRLQIRDSLQLQSSTVEKTNGTVRFASGETQSRVNGLC